MRAISPYPLLFDPIYKPKLWGGDSIFTHFGRPKPTAAPIGESWELADLEHDQSRVRKGPAAGSTLGELLATWGRQLVGPALLFEGRFPLLIKFLDARAWLSVQVHPNEAVARRLGGNVRVKHEAWYVLAAEPGGAIYHGLEPGVTAKDFREAMLTGRMDGILRKVPVQPGECYYLPSGTPHALGEGVLVAEIQTPSDVTYRTFDWNRIDPATGQPRELHLDAALECIDFNSSPPPPIQKLPPSSDEARTPLVACDWFSIDRTRWSEDPAQPGTGPSPTANPVSPEMSVWIWLEGAGAVACPSGEALLTLAKGDVVLWPATLTETCVRPSPDAIWLEVRVPAAG